MSIEIQLDTSSPHRFAFMAMCDGKMCGGISAHRAMDKVGGHVVYKVDDVQVLPTHRRKGIATKLYETAAAEACGRGARLASLERLSDAFSTQFWEKQVEKGRAIKLRPPRFCPARQYLSKERVAECFSRYVLKSCDIRDLSGLKRNRNRR